MGLRLYNTSTRQVEDFTPPPRLRGASDGQAPYEVKMYNCGPTVYNYAHIGNLRAYVFADILRRTLEMNGYTVKQIINITDVGHLISDADEGADKIEIGAKREGKSTEEIVKLYSDAFYDDLKALNIKAADDRGKEDSFPRATHHIPEQIALIEELAKKGFTYQTSDGIYFNTAKFPDYGKFAHLDIGGMRGGERIALGEKKNITDFALWKFSSQDGERREQEWDSPLGIARKGFPGWHVECSAMSRKYLGQPFDIHTGGVDHIPVHHTNEIAQSVAAYGVPLARFWMHSAHMTVDGQKMSKSLGNTYRLSDLAERGISPLAFRYWLLTAHYRTQVNFTWEALGGAQKAYDRLRKIISELPQGATAGIDQSYFDEKDLDTPKMIGALWINLEAKLPNLDYHSYIKKLDSVLGLKLLEYKEEKISVTTNLQKLLDARQSARETKNFSKSDRLRDEIKKLGYEVKDTSEGQKLEKLSG